MGAQYQVHGPVAVLTLDNPPVNGLGHDTRVQLAQGIERAGADRSILALVIIGAGKAFSAGADIKEFGTSKAIAEPNLASLIKQLEDCPKPVVAALHSICMGGGLELALGAHYRVAAPGTAIALPEVKIGLIPGAGGTQRLPRALGVEIALNMILSGEPVTSEVLACLPGQRLFDKIIDATNPDDLLVGAMALAVEAASQPGPYPRVRDLKASHPDADAYFGFVRHTIKFTTKNLPAPEKCVATVEASVKRNFDAGLQFERETFLALMLTPECKALRHAFFSERAASKISDVPEDTPQRAIERVGVIGAGTMGIGIAMNFLNAGIPVVMIEMQSQALDRGVATIRKNYDAQVKKGKLQQDRLEARMALLSTTLNYADLAQSDLVIEAVFEEMGVKEAVFKALDAVMKPGAILASNTSTLDLNAIAAFTKRPQDVVGMHFFSPAHVMKLLEVVRGERTSKDVLATVMAIAKKIRKTAVVSGVCDGFIGNRMLAQYGRQAGFLLDEGCTPEQVDRAIEQWGMAMGPFRVGDLAGNDISWAIRKRRYIEKPQMRYSKTADLLCELGRFGQKTGAGWYDYRADRRDALPSPTVVAMLEKHRADIGIKPRKISDEEIVHRLVYSLVNEAAHILEEGMASKASDIDVIYLTGYGFPRFRGGPMCYADSKGLFNVVQAMKIFALNPLDDGNFWQPAPLLAKLLAENKTFT